MRLFKTLFIELLLPDACERERARTRPWFAKNYLNGACPGVTINVIRHLQGQKDATAVGSPCQGVDDFLSEKPREPVSSALTLVHAIPLTYHLKS
jgi:hypothetical protein